MTDEQFLECITAGWDNNGDNAALEYILRYRLTTDQMTQLCSHIHLIPSNYVSEIIAHQDFDDHHFLSIMMYGAVSDRRLLFLNKTHRTKDQILYGLRDSHIFVRTDALNHHCCTEAIRVEFALVGEQL